jgi:hypothetical protein
MKLDFAKKIARRSLRIVALIIILILGIFIFWKYFYTYSEGYRAGLLQKFTRKGNVFKTYEGELILSSVTSTTNVALASEKFFFSVLDDSLANVLDTLQGQFVIIHYKQKNGKVIWRGDTPYFVDEVKLKGKQ